jgi:hypothetical protein
MNDTDLSKAKKLAVVILAWSQSTINCIHVEGSLHQGRVLALVCMAVSRRVTEGWSIGFVCRRMEHWENTMRWNCSWVYICVMFLSYLCVRIALVRENI